VLQVADYDAAHTSRDGTADGGQIASQELRDGTWLASALVSAVRRRHGAICGRTIIFCAAWHMEPLPALAFNGA